MDVARLLLASLVGGAVLYFLEGKGGRRASLLLILLLSLAINSDCILKYFCPPAPQNVYIICSPPPLIPYFLASAYTFLVLLLFYIIFSGIKEYLPLRGIAKYAAALLITLLLLQITLEVFPWLALSSWRFC